MKSYAHREFGPCLCVNCFVTTVADLALHASGLPGEHHYMARRMASNCYTSKMTMFEAVRFVQAELLKKATGA